MAKWCKNYIETYNKDTLESGNRIEVPNLEQARDLAICPRSKCLYISDSRRVIHAVTLGRCNSINNWGTCDVPEGISVNTNRTIVVSFPNKNKLVIYLPDGRIKDTIELPTFSQYVYPRHAIQMSADEFLVCYGGLGTDPNPEQSNAVNLYNNRTHDFSLECEEFTRQIVRPLRLAVTENGYIFVATFIGQSIFLLDPDLRLQLCLLQLRNNNINRMWFDSVDNCLYFANHEDVGKLYICKLNYTDELFPDMVDESRSRRESEEPHRV